MRRMWLFAVAFLAVSLFVPNPFGRAADEKPAPKKADKPAKPVKPQGDDDEKPDPADVLKKMLEKAKTDPGRVERNDDDDAIDAVRRMREMQLKQLQMLRGGIIGGGQIQLDADGNVQVLPFGGRLGANRGDLRLGIRFAPVTPVLTEQLGLPAGQGLVIEEVTAASAAEKAGFKAHDVLIEFDGKAVAQSAELVRRVREMKGDKAFDAVVVRKGKKETLKGIKLPEAPAPVPAVRGVPFRFPAVGGLMRGLPGSSSMQRNNDDFSATNTNNGVTVTVKGSIGANGPTVDKIGVDDGTGVTTYDSIAKVPAPHQEIAKTLLSMAAKGVINN